LKIDIKEIIQIQNKMWRLYDEQLMAGILPRNAQKHMRMSISKQGKNIGIGNSMLYNLF
jgi:hypothetical protein